MVKKDKELILNWITKKISSEEFWNSFGIDRKKFDYILETLNKGFKEENSELIEYSLLIYFKSFDGFFNKDNSQILYDLIIENWHRNHEDIARIIQKIRDVNSIPFLVKEMCLNLEYLEYNDGESLIRKCAYALADIDSNESLLKIKELSKSENQIIKASAIEQLDRKNANLLQ